MDDIKNWYESKTVWGAIIAIAAGLLQAGGIEVNNDVQAQLAESLLALSGAVGGIVALYGRFTAEKRVA